MIIMDTKERHNIITLVKREVVPAIGCTEPVAVALCAAKSKEILGRIPQEIRVLLSANVLKNAMGVGIPGTGGMIGLPIAVALGVLAGKSEYLLEVFKDVTPKTLVAGRKMVEDKIIDIKLKDNPSDKLYIEVLCTANGDTARAIIAGQHTNFVFSSINNSVLLDETNKLPETAHEDAKVELTLYKVYDFSMTAPAGEIAFILEAARINKAAAEISFQHKFGHELGNMLHGNAKDTLMGDTVFTNILAYTSAACDARMAGAMIPVMSNSGSGNQGIAATLPVAIFAERNKNSREQLMRALMLSHLTVIYIKQKLGRLSALCGCVIAATGSSCGIVHLMGGDYEQVSYAVKNMIANLTGMICDGAKPSCSMKLTSGVSTAVLSAMLAMERKFVTSAEGIIENDADKCIDNLTRIGSQAMQEIDKMTLDIMTHKK
jgi:L-cysteine desulfidase